MGMVQKNNIWAPYELKAIDFKKYDDVQNWVDSWVASKPKSFFQSGIRKLPERWAKVVASKGQYFD
uniref:Mariner Mos1 transposase n=1 Tax=Phlebotomus papatasi TaxID=29031 RepID=A0A1B0D986_PHLPP